MSSTDLSAEFNSLDPATLRRRGSAKWRAIPKDVLPAWVADMDFPVAEPIRKAIGKLVDSSTLGYSIPAERHDLIPIFCDRVAERFAWPIQPGQVTLLTDVVQGLYLGCQIFSEPGDGVVIQTPIYPRFLDAVKNTGRRLVANPLAWSGERFELDIQGLRSAIDSTTRILMLCHPHNPTGRVFGRAELESLAELALEKNLIVLSDEIHADLVYGGHRHIPFASISPEISERTVTLMSASKAFNIAGLHCGLAIFGGDEVQERFEHGPVRTRGMVNSLGMAGSLAAFQQGQPWLDAVLEQLQQNRELVESFVAEHMPEIDYATPEATYMAWLDCRPLELQMEPRAFFLHHARVALSAGSEFGPGGEGCVRLNFATSRQILGEILDRMADAIARRRRDSKRIQMTMSPHRPEIESIVKKTLDQVRSLEEEKGIDRDTLGEIQNLLVDMTKRKDLFGKDNFPEPTGEMPAAIYLISADEGDRFALYLVCAKSDTAAPPHDHTTWAVIAGIEGQEENVIWERVDDRSIPGKGELKEARRVVLEDGDAIAFLGDDIHSIKVVSDGPTRHFHLYGKGFDQQTERVSYNLDKGTYVKLPTGLLPVDESRRIA